MRWFVFAGFVFVILAMQQGFASLLEIRGVRPNLLLIVAAYIALAAPPATARWAAMMLGLLVDLTEPYFVAAGASHAGVVLIGPAALGFLAGAVVVVELRGLMFRDSPVSLPVIVFIKGIFVSLVIVALLSLRCLVWGLGDALGTFSAADELVYRFWQLLYTAAVAFPLGLVLIFLDRLWGFAHANASSHAARSRTKSAGRVQPRRIV